MSRNYNHFDSVQETQSDEHLVLLFRGGDGGAFAVLVQRYRRRLERWLCALLRSADLADEVGQSTFVKAALRIGQLGDGGSFWPWLLVIARTTALDYLRRESYRKLRPAGDESADETDPRVNIDVYRTLAELGDSDREVLVLSDLLGMSIAELAHCLHLGDSAVKMRVLRARTRFRTLYLGKSDAP